MKIETGLKFYKFGVVSYRFVVIIILILFLINMLIIYNQQKKIADLNIETEFISIVNAQQKRISNLSIKTEFNYGFNSVCGQYNYDTDTIQLNMLPHYSALCGSLFDTLLHEQKHQWCWKNKHDEELKLLTHCNIMFNVTKDNYESKFYNKDYTDCVHKGCFSELK